METINRLRDDEMTILLPHGALAVFLLTWGALSDHLVLAIVLSVLAEGIKLQNLRWDLSPKHFQNIADFSTVLFAVVAVYQFIQYGFHGIYGILGLLPLIVFPLVFAQRASIRGLFPMSALFLSLRKKIAEGNAQEQWVSTELIFALGCLLAASTGDSTGSVYFYCTLFCAVVMLFSLRPNTVTFRNWLVAVAMVAGLSVLIRTGLELGYRQVESSMSYWFSQFKWSSVDPNRTRTAIGHIGRLKLSDRIALRVKAPLSIPLPLYIHEATYTEFNLGSWHSSDRNALAIDRITNSTRYPLITEARKDNATRRDIRVEITAKQAKDVSVQAFPIGSIAAEGDEIIELKKNSLGTISLEAIPGQLRYHVDYRPDDANARDQLRGQPLAADLRVPENYIKAFKKVADDLELMSLSQDAAVARVHQFFQQNYSYSLIGKSYYPGKKPLLDFLNNSRSGHCEYFATASTLLLRVAGIPSRYSVGYVVDEYSSLEGAFIARARHAHAWTEAFVDGHWQVVDTTPANWYALEEQRVSNWQSVQDYLAWLELHLNRLQRVDRSNFNQLVIWVVPVLLVWLMWRLRKKITVKDTPPGNQHHRLTSTTSQEAARLIAVLKQLGLPTRDGQTVQKILNNHCPPEIPSGKLTRIIDLYNKARFSNSLLSIKEYHELTDGIDSYIKELSTSTDAPPN